MCLSRLEKCLLAAHHPNPGCDRFGVVEGADGIEPCQWCHERSELLDMPELLARPQSEALGTFENDLPI